MNIRKMISGLSVGACVGMAGMGMQMASANVTVSALSPTVMLVTSGAFTNDYSYSYGIYVDSSETLETGNSFTFYDFYGYAGAAPVTNYSVMSGLNLTPQSGSGPTDPGKAPDVEFTYNGTPSIVGAGTAGTFLGNFTLYSTVANYGLGFHNFTGGATETATNQENGNTTNVVAPLAPSSVPEPSTVASFGLGGFGLLGLMLRTRKARRTAA